MVQGKRVTLTDVAADAGVSRATASLVVRGDGRLAHATRRRVMESMDRLGYVYHRSAASLRLRRSESVGLLVTDISHLFFAEMAVGFEQTLERKGMMMSLSNTFDDADRQERLLTVLTEQQVDALALVPVQGSDAELLSRLGRMGVPYLLTTRHLGDTPAPYLGPDDRQGGRLAVRHLIEHGCTKLVYLGGPNAATARRDRVAGYHETLREAPSEVRDLGEIPGGIDGKAGRSLAREVLRLPEFPDGIVCHTDTIAYGLYRQLRDEAPERLAKIGVIGFDDLAESELWEPPLTSVSVHPQRLGERAAEMLYEAARPGGTPITEPFLVEPELMVRHSCGC